MAYSKTGFNPRYSESGTIEKEKINMGAMFYLHIHQLLMSLSEARIDDTPDRYYNILDALLMQVEHRIKDLVDINKIYLRLKDAEVIVDKYGYYNYCLTSGEGNPGAMPQLQQASRRLWTICREVFREIYSAMDEKGLILPDKTLDGIGDYLKKFGIETGNVLGGPQSAN